MGQFIRLRLTNELYVLKKDRWGCAYDTDRITDMLNSWFNMQLYDAEELEDSEFEPFFAGIEGKLSGKKVALFGSYGWGDGEWMRQWQDRVTGDGATLVNGEGLIVNETPDDDALASCKALGEALAK